MSDSDEVSPSDEGEEGAEQNIVATRGHVNGSVSNLSTFVLSVLELKCSEPAFFRPI